MPLEFYYKGKSDIKLGIWNITEEDFELEAMWNLNKDDSKLYASLSDKRKKEWLTARILCSAITNLEDDIQILKDQYGKPHIAESEINISLSHCFPYALVSAGKKVHGIDIQKRVEKIYRIQNKFCSHDELNYAQDHIDYLQVIWGLKESMYKAWGRKKIEYKSQLAVEAFQYQPEGGYCKSFLRKDDNTWIFDSQYFKYGSFYVCASVLKEITHGM